MINQIEDLSLKIKLPVKKFIPKNLVKQKMFIQKRIIKITEDENNQIYEESYYIEDFRK